MLAKENEYILETAEATVDQKPCLNTVIIHSSFQLIKALLHLILLSLRKEPPKKKDSYAKIPIDFMDRKEKPF